MAAKVKTVRVSTGASIPPHAHCPTSSSAAHAGGQARHLCVQTGKQHAVAQFSRLAELNLQWTFPEQLRTHAQHTHAREPICITITPTQQDLAQIMGFCWNFKH